MGLGRMTMTIGKPLVLSLALLVGSAPIVLAGEKPVSKIRKAAIERMQEKLGGLRGSIAPQDRIVMLTNKLIEMQKPVQRATRIRGSRGFDTVTTGSIKLAIDERGSFYSLERKSRHSGFDVAAGAVPLGPDEDHYAEAAGGLADHNRFEPQSF